MTSFMLREGSSLLKQRDIVIPDLDDPRSFTLIDVKIFDPAAPTYADSSAKSSAQHRHRALEAAGPREYFGASRRPPPGSRMRICTFVVSSFGSLGTQALGLIKDIVTTDLLKKLFFDDVRKMNWPKTEKNTHRPFWSGIAIDRAWSN